MGLHRALPDVQAARDLLVGQPGRHPFQDVPLATGPLVQPWGGADVPLGEVRDQPPHQRRRDHGVAARGGVHRAADLVGRHALEQIAVGARPHRLGQQGIVGEGRQDHHARAGQAGRVLADPSCGTEPVQARHPYVEQRQVRPVFADQGHRLDPVGGLGHHLQPVVELER